MEGTVPTCYSGGDVWNIKVSFCIAVREVTSKLIKRVIMQFIRGRKTHKSLQDIKKQIKTSSLSLGNCTNTAINIQERTKLHFTMDSEHSGLMNHNVAGWMGP